MKKVYIINGSGGVGKDTFVEMVTIHLNDYYKKLGTVINFSSVDKVKEIAKYIGWNGSKSEKDRKFLSDLKFLTSEYCDLPFNSMKEKYEYFMSDKCNAKVLFLHIREPEEIEKAKIEFSAKTIIITRNSIKHITSNEADKNVFDYNYDYTIENDSDFDSFYMKTKEFVLNEIVK